MPKVKRKSKSKPGKFGTAPPPTKAEIVQALQDANDAFDQATDDYITAVQNQTGIQAAQLALIIAFRNLKNAEGAALTYILGTVQ